MKMFMRILFYCIGLLFMAFGVAFSVNSNLGVSPVNSLPYVVSLISNVSLGTCVVIVYGIYILVQILIKRRDFKWINLTQIIFSTVFGYFADFAKAALAGFTIPTYAGKLVMLAISIVLVAVGVCIYMDTKLVNMPMEGMTLAISECFPEIPFYRVKIVVDCSSVAVGVILSFLFLHGLYGIREGTVICALLVGRVLPIVKKRLDPIIEKICF
ncbi:MAG: DUF6198 family protein [Clostridiales bacterium]|nr:DUF6198 family protein [Clostridiales bacterium]MCD8154966.1 DUF6198 family protein [Clostridiales bacterium]